MRLPDLGLCAVRHHHGAHQVVGMDVIEPRRDRIHIGDDGKRQGGGRPRAGGPIHRQPDILPDRLAEAIGFGDHVPVGVMDEVGRACGRNRERARDQLLGGVIEIARLLPTYQSFAL